MRLSTAIWLWALQLGALFFMRIGKKIEGAEEGSNMPPVVQVVLLCSILGMVMLGVAREVSTYASVPWQNDEQSDCAILCLQTLEILPSCGT